MLEPEEDVSREELEETKEERKSVDLDPSEEEERSLQDMDDQEQRYYLGLEDPPISLPSPHQHKRSFKISPDRIPNLVNLNSNYRKN